MYVRSGRAGGNERHLLFYVRSEKTWPHPMTCVASTMYANARNVIIPTPPPKKKQKMKRMHSAPRRIVDGAPTTLSAWVLPLWIVKWTSWWEVKAYTVIYTLKKHSYDSLPFASPWWSQFRSQMYGGRNLPCTASEGVYWLCWYSYTMDMERYGYVINVEILSSQAL